MENTNLKITSIEELQNYSKGEIVELPSFREGAPFVARLKRPSMMALVKTGRIPNSLVTSASKLFNGKGVDDNNPKAMGQAFEVFDALCEAAFMEPTYKEIKEAGVELTDEQYMAIFNYTQRGIRALEPFRAKPINTGSARSGAEVQGEALEPAGN